MKFSLLYTSIDKLFMILSRFWNFTNHALLVGIINTYCNGGISSYASEYCESLETFEKTTTVDVYVSATDASNKMSQKFVKMAAKINKPASQCTLYEVRKLVQSLSESSGISAHSVYINSISISSVRVEFQLHPAAVAPILAALNTSFLEDHLLMEVIVDGQPLDVLHTMDAVESVNYMDDISMTYYSRISPSLTRSHTLNGTHIHLPQKFNRC